MVGLRKKLDGIHSREKAAWRIGVFDKELEVIKNSDTKAASRADHETPCENIFDSCGEAQDKLHWQQGYSQFEVLHLHGHSKTKNRWEESVLP